MPFLNETLHPKANALVNHFIMARCMRDNGKADFYKPLENWRTAQGMSDEKASDLYSRIAEHFDHGSFLAINDNQRLGGMSRCLWANDKEVLA